MINKSDIVGKLNLHRLEHKLTQVEIAKLLNVSFQTVNRWINRKVKPSQLQEHQIKKLLQNNRRMKVRPRG